MTGWKKALREHEGTTRDAGLDSAARHISAALNEDIHLSMRVLHVTWAGCIIRRVRKADGTGSVTAPHTTVSLSGDELLWQALLCVGVAARNRANSTEFLWDAEQVLRQWWEAQR